MKTTWTALLVALACGCGSSGSPEASSKPADAAPASDVAVDVADAQDVGAEASEPDLPCTNIIDACHEADPGYGPIHDCHELGHTGTVDDCRKAEKNCLAICAGTADAATD